MQRVQWPGMKSPRFFYPVPLFLSRWLGKAPRYRGEKDDRKRLMDKCVAAPAFTYTRVPRARASVLRNLR